MVLGSYKLRPDFQAEDLSLNNSCVVFHLGYVPTMRFLYGSRYREATEQAVSNFMKKDKNHRVEQDDLKKTVYSYPKLKPVPSYKEPTNYPDLTPKYAKGYLPSKYGSLTNMLL